MTTDEQRAFYPTGADLRAMGQTLACDVNLWGERLERAYYPSTTRRMDTDERRLYDRTQRRNWAGRRRTVGKRIA